MEVEEGSADILAFGLRSVEESLQIACAELGEKQKEEIARKRSESSPLCLLPFSLSLGCFSTSLCVCVSSLCLSPYLGEWVQRVRSALLQLVSTESIVLQVLRVLALDRIQLTGSSPVLYVDSFAIIYISLHISLPSLPPSLPPSFATYVSVKSGLLKNSENRSKPPYVCIYFKKG